MRSSKKRLDQVEASLTPRQAVLLWMEEAHQFPNMPEYARSLKDEPESAWPMAKLPNQVANATRAAMKGMPKEEVSTAVRDAVRDVVFLYHLHQRVNMTVYESLEPFMLRANLLSTELLQLIRDKDLSDTINLTLAQISMETPYPLDPETAAAVEAAKKHHVVTWDYLEESGIIEDWVTKSFIEEGKTELPYGAYTGGVDEEELQTLFHDSEAYEEFMASKDFSYGLAYVRDETFEARYESVEQAIKDLVEAGDVEAGLIVHLETVPNPFLADAPLVAAEWLDRYLVELAEWGAHLKKKGFSLQYSQDSHPLAWDEFVPESKVEDAEADVDQIQTATWKKATEHLAKFPGRIRDIDGRPYIHLNDYGGWRGRWLKGNLSKTERRGLVNRSWSHWIEQQGGKAILAGVRVETIACYIESFLFRSCVDFAEAQGQTHRRTRMLHRLSDWTIHDPRGDEYWNRVTTWQAKPFLSRVQDWKAVVEGFLAELYGLQQAAVSIGERYFDGQDLLFADVAERFQQILKAMETSVELFNDTIGQDLEKHRLLGLNRCLEEARISCGIDLAAIKRDVSQYSDEKIAYVVDMSKAEALEDLGDFRQAVVLVERHV